MARALVAYFSVSGKTRRVAERLAEAIGADIAEIVPETPYTATDVNWRDRQSRSSLEMADRTSRPAIAAPVPDTAAYDVVFVGFPIWWYREPSIVDTFVESCDLAGKTVVPFATSGGSGIGDSGANIQALAPGARVAVGKRLSPVTTAASLSRWAAEWL